MKDLKYLMSYSIALMAFIGISLGGFYNYLAVVFTFIFIPILETIVKKSNEEYTQEEKESRLLDPFFDLLLYFNIPIVFGIFFFSLDKLIYTSSISDIIGIILSASIVMATNGINVGHELGHRKSIIARTCSKLLYLPCQYMHFYIEHNFGHHLHVATPEDGATAKYNQSVYSFWFTSVTKQYFDAWKNQKTLLKTKNSSFFSLKNDMLWYHLIQPIYLLIIYYLFSFEVMIFAFVVGIISFLFLECINYIEHYGLQRKKLDSGRYERVQPHHSWNSNFNIGRITLYELTRHSDHHYKSSKKYQVLDSFKECPTLPVGYPASILLSFIPPLWFWVMNPRVPNEMKSDK